MPPGSGGETPATSAELQQDPAASACSHRNILAVIPGSSAVNHNVGVAVIRIDVLTETVQDRMLIIAPDTASGLKQADTGSYHDFMQGERNFSPRDASSYRRAQLCSTSYCS